MCVHMFITTPLLLLNAREAHTCKGLFLRCFLASEAAVAKAYARYLCGLLPDEQTSDREKISCGFKSLPRQWSCRCRRPSPPSSLSDTR